MAEPALGLAIILVLTIRLIPASIESVFYYFDIDHKLYNIFSGSKIAEPLGGAQGGVSGLCFFGFASGFAFSFFTTSATLISRSIEEAFVVFGLGALVLCIVLLLAVFSTKIQNMAARPSRRQKLYVVFLTTPILLLFAVLPYA